MAEDSEQTVAYTLDHDAAALLLGGNDILGCRTNGDSPMTMVTAADPQDLLQQLAAGGCTQEEQSAADMFEDIGNVFNSDAMEVVTQQNVMQPQMQQQIVTQSMMPQQSTTQVILPAQAMIQQQFTVGSTIVVPQQSVIQSAPVAAQQIIGQSQLATGQATSVLAQQLAGQSSGMVLQQATEQQTVAQNKPQVATLQTAQQMPAATQQPTHVSQTQLAALQAAMQNATPRQTTQHQLVYQPASANQINGQLIRSQSIVNQQVRQPQVSHQIINSEPQQQQQQQIHHVVQPQAVLNQLQPQPQQSTQQAIRPAPRYIQRNSAVHILAQQQQRVKQQQQLAQQRVTQQMANNTATQQYIQPRQPQATGRAGGTKHVNPISEAEIQQQVQQNVQHVFQNTPSKALARTVNSAPLSTSVLSSVLHSKPVQQTPVQHIVSQNHRLPQPQRSVVMASPHDEFNGLGQQYSVQQGKLTRPMAASPQQPVSIPQAIPSATTASQLQRPQLPQRATTNASSPAYNNVAQQNQYPAPAAGIRTSNPAHPPPPQPEPATKNIQVPLVAVPDLNEHRRNHLENQPDIKNIEERRFESGDEYLLVEYIDGNHRAFKSGSAKPAVSAASGNVAPGNVPPTKAPVTKPATPNRSRKSGSRGGGRGSNSKRAKMQLQNAQLQEQSKIAAVNAALQSGIHTTSQVVQQPQIIYSHGVASNVSSMANSLQTAQTAAGTTNPGSRVMVLQPNNNQQTIVQMHSSNATVAIPPQKFEVGNQYTVDIGNNRKILTTFNGTNLVQIDADQTGSVVGGGLNSKGKTAVSADSTIQGRKWMHSTMGKEQLTRRPLHGEPLTTTVVPLSRPPKPFEKGKYALCAHCGNTSENYLNCDGCGKQLPDDVKYIQKSTAGQIGKNVFYGNAATNLKAASPKTVRKKKNTPIETVTILSSDDEDASADKTAKDAIQPHSNTPLVGQTAQAVAKLLNKTPQLGITTSHLNKDSDAPDAPGTAEAKSGEIGSPEANTARRVLFQSRSVRIGNLKTSCIANTILAHDSLSLRLLVNSTPLHLVIPIPEIMTIQYNIKSDIPVLFITLTPEGARKVREACKMEVGQGCYFDPASNKEEEKRLTILIETLTAEQHKKLHTLITSVLSKTVMCLEMDDNASNKILLSCTPTNTDQQQASVATNYTTSTIVNSMPTLQHMILLKKLKAPNGLYDGNSEDEDMADRSRSPTPPHNMFSGEIIRLCFYPPPPTTGGISITNEDLFCMNDGEFLNDVIIDFYLKYIYYEHLSEEDRSRTHIFSSFFYRRLTQKVKTEEDNRLPLAVRRHSRVRRWTRHVDLFSKDFIFVPINENAHWYLAVICFPSMVPEPSPNTPKKGAKGGEPKTPKGRKGANKKEQNKSAEKTTVYQSGKKALLDKLFKVTTLECKTTASTTAPSNVPSSATSPSATPDTSTGVGTSEALSNISTAYAESINDQVAQEADSTTGDAGVSSNTTSPDTTATALSTSSTTDATPNTCSTTDAAASTSNSLDNAASTSSTADATPSTTDTTPSTSSTDMDTTPVKPEPIDKDKVVKQPVILLFDSLAGPTRGSVMRTLREYLQIEWNEKKLNAEGKRVFDKDSMKGSSPRCPQQNNFSDCGTYVLQYVDSFFKNPITDYRIPFKDQLVNWFSDSIMETKRTEIKQLILALMHIQNPNLNYDASQDLS